MTFEQKISHCLLFFISNKIPETHLLPEIHNGFADAEFHRLIQLKYVKLYRY